MAEKGSATPAELFLRNLSEERLVQLSNMLRYWERLAGRPHILKWLENVREDELELLDDAIELAKASNTVGKFLWWTVVSVVGIALLSSQITSIAKDILAWIRQG